MKLKKTLAAFSLLPFAIQPLAAELKISPIGIRVVAKGYEGNGKYGSDELRAFSWNQGTSLALLITQETDLPIVRFDENNAKITTFKDNTGFDFLKVKSKFSAEPISFSFPEISEDGKALIVTLDSDGLPAKGAHGVILEGEFTLETASESKITKSSKTPAKKGQKITIGDYAFKVTEAGKPKFGDSPMEVTLESSFDPKQFRGFKFYDPEGNEIESSPNGWSSSGFGNKFTYSTTYSLKQETPELIIGLDQWSNLTTVKVPLNLKINLGL